MVQYRKYPRVISLRAKRMIESVGGKIIGVVLNNINVARATAIIITIPITRAIIIGQRKAGHCRRDGRVGRCREGKGERNVAMVRWAAGWDAPLGGGVGGRRAMACRSRVRIPFVEVADTGRVALRLDRPPPYDVPVAETSAAESAAVAYRLRPGRLDRCGRSHARRATL